jgi:hypothetical protein
MEGFMSSPEATGLGLTEHWEWAARKGLVNAHTARSLKAASKQVLSVLDDWESVSVESLDVDDVFRRFVNLRGRDFKPESLESYKSRFKQAISLYLSYIKNPAGWKPKTRNRTTTPERRKPAPRIEMERHQDAGAEVSLQGLISYPFPLRQGTVARLTLPADLTTAEVKRLTAYMTFLAIDSDHK